MKYITKHLRCQGQHHTKGVLFMYESFFGSKNNLPLSFLCGGKRINGIPTEWNPEKEEAKISDTITETTYRGKSPEGLSLRVCRRRYLDVPAIEYVAYFTNEGTAETPMMEDIRIEGLLAGKNATLWRGNGDTCNEEAFQWWSEPLGTENKTIEPRPEGISCKDAFPYLRLQMDGCGYNIAIGWTGYWTSDIRETEDGIFLSAGQKRCHMVIRPSETMRTPSLVLMSYTGDEIDGANTWRRWYFAHILPRENGKLLPPKCCMHHMSIGEYAEGCGMTEENQLAAIDGYLKGGIHPDIWWMDAGWYSCNYHWMTVGNWFPNPDGFPNGLAPISEKCKKENIDFLLWFEPERSNTYTQFGLEHPEWLIHWYRDGKDYYYCLVDLGIPECCDFVIDMIDQKIKEYGIKIYRQDCNLYPLFFWRVNEAEDRIGAMENLHIQGYYRFWDTILERNPGLLIDSCAGGGRRNDIETMKRSVPLHYTDVGYGNHPLKFRHHQWHFAWLPYFRAHNMNWWNEEKGVYEPSTDIEKPAPDKYSYYAAMTPALTDVMRYYASEEAFALAREMHPIWRRAAELMIGTDYYSLTPVCQSSDDFYAAQFHDPESGEGFVHVMNGTTASETDFTVKLRGLDENTLYTLTSTERKTTVTMTGKELMEAFSVSMGRKTGDIWFYKSASKGETT